MKKLWIIVLSLVTVVSACFAETSTQKDIHKLVKKEVKRLAKEGWMVSPGALPLEKQLERAYLMQYEQDENQSPRYIMGEASSVGDSYDSAKADAMSLAITNLAAHIQSEVTALIEHQVEDRRISQEDAKSISETVMASQDLISKSIGRAIPVMECYRTTRQKDSEVLIRIAYDAEMAKEAARQAVRDELAKKGNHLHEQLDTVLGF